MTTITGRLRRRVAGGVVGAVALAGATVVATPGAGLTSSAHAAAAQCSTDETSSEFGGAKVSATYGAYFNRGGAQHWLDQPYTPQGLGAWPNWRGGTEDVLVVGMHHENENDNKSLIYAVTPGGTHRGAAYLPVGAHAGGVKIYGKWLYVQQNTSTIRRYLLSTVRDSFLSPGVQSLGNGTALSVTGVSSFDIDGGYLYGAKFNKDSRDVMRRYKITSTGGLSRDWGWGPLQVPKKTQGLLVLSNTYIFSTSYGRNARGNVYVVRRGYTKSQEFTDVRYRCFQSVAMIQELTGMNGTTYLLNESGAQEFDDWWDQPIHKIRHLHVANTESLRNMVW